MHTFMKFYSKLIAPYSPVGHSTQKTRPMQRQPLLLESIQILQLRRLQCKYDDKSVTSVSLASSVG